MNPFVLREIENINANEPSGLNYNGSQLSFFFFFFDSRIYGPIHSLMCELEG